VITYFAIGSAGDSANYHDKAFRQDGNLRADNYYLNEQSAATWQGQGAALLGWEGQAVSRDQFIEVLEGRMPHPETGAVQDLSVNAVARRPGADLSVAPSKSVSIVALVGGDERVVEAHKMANARAMAWLEEHASIVRVRVDGHPPQPMKAGNLLYATVIHETDRLNEPQLHSHNVMPAVVYDREAGKWRSLTNDALLTLRTQADQVYKAELAKGLRLAGYELDYRANGIDFEIRGLTPEQVKAFSQRSDQIDAKLRQWGIDPADASYEARQAAALDSRNRKQELPREELHQRWDATAREAGLDLASVVSAARERAAHLDLDRLSRQERSAAMRAVTWGLEHLSEREQAFRLADLETAALSFDKRLTMDAVQRAVAEHATNGQLVPRGLDKMGADLATTPKALAAEQSLIADITAARNTHNVVLHDAKDFEQAVSAFEAHKSKEVGAPFKLSAEQLNAARNALMHPDSIQGIQGEAGTGKTAALAMVREVAEARGWKVMGMATSSSAATELQASSGIQSQTVASFFIERENAMRATRLEIEQLQAALARRHDEADVALGPVRAERHKVTVQAEGVSFGTHHYVFDHRRAEVFRSATGFASLVGNFLMDSADTLRERATKANSLGGQLQAQALQWGAAAADQLGHRITRFEKVGVVEGALARSALYLDREAPGGALERALALKAVELHNLERTGNREGRKTLLVMDEASLTGAADTAKVSALARSIGARMIFQGDTKQHGSIPAGRAFWLAQQHGMNTSVLEETRRFDKATDSVKQSLQDMKRGEFGLALSRLNTLEVDNADLALRVADRYVRNLQDLRAQGIADARVGIVSLTNNDRKAINMAVHRELKTAGLVGSESHTKLHLDDPKLTAAERAHAGKLQAAGVDRLIMRQRYRELGVEKYEVVPVVGYDVDRNRVQIRRSDGQLTWLDPMKHERFSPAKEEKREFAVGDLVEARGNLRVHGTGTDQVKNGSRGVLQAVDAKGATVQWNDGRTTRLTDDLLQFVDHGYARTSFKEQGATNHREILAVSARGAGIINREATYVAATRAKDNTEIVTADRAKMLKNAGQDVSKLTALNPHERPLTLDEIMALHRQSLPQAPAQTQLQQERLKQREQGQNLQRDLGWSF
jgi:conjugative relaxase-like TrwC/TraI family protein